MGVFAMPSLGADMEDGTLTDWLVSVGDTVARGDIVAVVETQKGAIEIECFEEGSVIELLVPEGHVVPVGAPLARIGAPGEAEVPEPAAAPKKPVAEPEVAAPAAAPKPAAPAVPNVPEPPEPPAPGPIAPGIAKASPAARVRARDLGVALDGLAGTGPEGMIVVADVDRAAKGDAQTTKPAAARDAMREAISAAMVRSKQTIPHFYLSHSMDVQPAIDHLARLNADRLPADRILLGAMMVRATALAVRDFPGLNGHDAGGGFVQSDEVNVGLAIALRGGGLVAPAIMQADTLTLDQTMAAMRDLVTRARSARLRSREMTAGTITLSSLGESGAEAMAGVIFPPQVALVGTGAPQIRPWVVDDHVQSRSVLTVTLSVDHRASDGRGAARFLSAFEAHLSTPEDL